MVKSYALHFIVFFIIESNFLSSKNCYSSIADAIAPPNASAIRGQVLIDETRTAHDYNNNNNRHHRHRRLNNFNITTINPNNNNVHDEGSDIQNNNSANKIFDMERHNQQQQRNSKIRQSHQTTKTPRMIHRLIGGHIKHPMQPSTEENLILATMTTIIEPTTRNLGRRVQTSNNYRKLNRRKTTVLKKLITTPKPQPKIEDEDSNFNDDEAFLDDEPKELDNWDNGILRLSAGAGKEDKLKLKKKVDSTKTLAEQVEEGKYGLIENEIFRKPPKRPGVISYLQNDEFPHDNEKSYGGLNDEDIWLAEDHLLVIKGGGLNDKDDLKEWPPIDDYQASGRQIKIPSNPKIPPPFPVQLEENGPLQFIGNNKFTFIDPIVNESLSIYTSGYENYSPSETENNNEKNILTGQRTIENTTKNVGYFYPQANPISWPAATLDDNQTFFNTDDKLNGALDNSTDYFDEDDPSLYYPPPYSFVYKNNYTNPVAPGPLVPGIVLPPPPDSFSRLEDDNDKKQKAANEIPFRQILTKISDYKTTSANRHKSASPSRTTTSSPLTNRAEQKNEIVYAVNQPAKTKNDVGYNPQQQYIIPSVPTPLPVPEVISFVPKSTTSTSEDTLSKENPIYYEYFEAQKTPAPNPVYYSEQLTSAPAPPSPTTPGISSTGPTRPFRRRQRVKTTTNQTPVLQQPNYNNKPYLTAQPTPLSYEDVVYITPKPEIRPSSVSLNNNNIFVPLVISKPSYKRKPIQNFEHDVDAIRQTLQYYNVEQLQSNNIPRTPKEKSIFQYSSETKNSPTAQPPVYDTEPFKPMVKYSAPASDANGFKAMPLVKIDKTKEIRNQKYYKQPSTAQIPDDKVRVQILYNPAKQIQDYYASSPAISQPSSGQQTDQGKDNNNIAIAQSNTQSATQNPWVSIEKQVLQEVNNNGASTPMNTRPPKKHRRPSFRKIEPSSNQFSGYFYSPPQSPSPNVVSSTQPRQNNRYYDEPFSNHIAAIQNKLSEYQQPRPQKQWSLENDTYVNYVKPRPHINPNSEFIARDYQERDQYRVETPPPPPQSQPMPRQHVWSLENDTYINFIPENRPPINPDAEYITQHRQNLQTQSLQYRQPYRQQPYQLQQQQKHQQQQQQQQQQQPWSLINDTYVNYVHPRPPQNPNAELIGNRQQSQFYPQYYQQRPQNNFNALPQRQSSRIPQNNGAVHPGHSYGGDTDVNYRQPYPQINPNSEFINQQQQSQYRQQHYYQQQQQNQQSGGNNNYYQNRKRSPK